VGGGGGGGGGGVIHKQINLERKQNVASNYIIIVIISPGRSKTLYHCIAQPAA